MRRGAPTRRGRRAARGWRRRRRRTWRAPLAVADSNVWDRRSDCQAGSLHPDDSYLFTSCVDWWTGSSGHWKADGPGDIMASGSASFVYFDDCRLEDPRRAVLWDQGIRHPAFQRSEQGGASGFLDDVRFEAARTRRASRTRPSASCRG